MKKILTKVFVIAMAIVLLTACAAPAAPAAHTADLVSVPAAATKELVKVRIGTQPWIGYGPWWIAKEKGLL